MDYIKCILRKKTTVSFIKCLNSIQFDGEEEGFFFERAKTFDDVSLIVSLKHFFDLSDKIKKGKGAELTIDHLMKTARDLEDENSEYLVNLDSFDKDSIMEIIQFNYSDFRESHGNLLEILSEIQKLNHNGQVI